MKNFYEKNKNTKSLAITMILCFLVYMIIRFLNVQMHHEEFLLK